jgi:hypothetical protein
MLSPVIRLDSHHHRFRFIRRLNSWFNWDRALLDVSILLVVTVKAKTDIAPAQSDVGLADYANRNVGNGLRTKRVKGVEPEQNMRIPREKPHVFSTSAPNASPTLSLPVVADGDDSEIDSHVGIDSEDGNLSLVVSSWHTLPEPIKAGIIAMVKASR